MSPTLVGFWIVNTALATIVAARIGSRRKGRPNLGLVLGLLLGWIGVIIIAATPPTRDALILRAYQQQQIQREAAALVAAAANSTDKAETASDNAT